MPPKKRGLQEGAGGGEEGEGASSGGFGLPVLKKRCRSFDLEIRGCRNLQELAARCLQSVQVRLDAAIDSAVARITEDVTKAVRSFLSHSPSLCRTVVDQNRPPRYRLSFMNGLDSEVFTKNPINAANGEPIKVYVLVNDQQGSEETEFHRRILSAKIKVVVLDGDFNKHNQECWTSKEFKDCIVQPRDNVGSVLTGASELRLRNGEAFLCGIAINDNSKFVRSGKFRLGVIIDDNLDKRVLEGITEPFTVKDRRGEGTKKSIIPLLNDDVWRLKKIAKDGAFHKALKDSGINCVQDFLRLYYKDEPALRKILFNAKKKVWTTIVEHAKNCDPGKKLQSFVVQGNNNVKLFFNSVFQIVGATFGDNYTPFSDLDMELVGEWSKDAYKYMTFHQPDYELYNGKPRPLNQSAFHELSMLEHKSTDLMQGPNGEESNEELFIGSRTIYSCSLTIRLLSFAEQYICETDEHQDTLDPNSELCDLKRLGSMRDASFEFSMPTIPEQYCASPSENDITDSATLHYANNIANETTGSMVLTEAPLTMDQQFHYILPDTDNGNSRY